MASPLLNGLRLLELLVDGKSTQAQVGAMLGVNRSTVLRAARTLASDGWLTQRDTHWELGPRALVLGAGTPARRRALRAEEVAHAVAGATGLTTFVGQLSGRTFYQIVWATGTIRLAVPAAVPDAPLHVFAASQCLLTDVDPADLDDYLGPEPYAAYGPNTLTSRADVLARIESIRAGRPAVELEESAPGHACVALPWRFGAQDPMMAVACLGTLDAIIAGQDRIEAVLRAAIAPGATLSALSPLVRTASRNPPNE